MGKSLRDEARAKSPWAPIRGVARILVVGGGGSDKISYKVARISVWKTISKILLNEDF